MPVVECKVGWESDDWSYIVLQGESELKYTKVPSSIIVDKQFIYIEQSDENFRCILKDMRYKEYNFICFKIRSDQFVDDNELELEAKNKYQEWCLSVYKEVKAWKK